VSESAEFVAWITTFVMLAAALAFTIYEMRRLADQAEREAERQRPRLPKPIFKSVLRLAAANELSLPDANEVFRRAARIEESDWAGYDSAINVRVSTDRIPELTVRFEVLRKRVTRLTEENSRQSKALDVASIEKATLQCELEYTRAQLQSTMYDLDRAQDDRDQTCLRTARLETEIGALSDRLHIAENTTRQQDRDIRDLMGARQLYIADVLDVNQHGESRKAFGRVFYTEGKFLIFYAFDLDWQPGVMLSKTFQAWGLGNSHSSDPLSLGIFSIDSESDRRWLLKSADPDVLANVSTVFVTAEPSSGSRRPSGRPFLFASLGSHSRKDP
jgi:hypothetical protein